METSPIAMRPAPRFAIALFPFAVMLAALSCGAPSTQPRKGDTTQGGCDCIPNDKPDQDNCGGECCVPADDGEHGQCKPLCNPSECPSPAECVKVGKVACDQECLCPPGTAAGNTDPPQGPNVNNNCCGY